MEIEEIKFKDQIKLEIKSKKWQNNTLYHVAMIHELNGKYQCLLSFKPNLFLKLSRIAEYDMVERFAKLLKIDKNKTRRLLSNKSFPKNKKEEGIREKNHG